MAKIVDITEKLSFDENPVMVIKGQQLEVNADAETMLRMMGAFKNENQTDAALKAYELMFSEEGREKIAKMKLPFKDLMKVIELAIEMVQGGGDDTGEAGTHTTI